MIFISKNNEPKMKYTTFFPSIVWRFSIYTSSILILILRTIEYFISDGKILDSIVIGIINATSHFVIGYVLGFVLYIFFAKIGNELIEKGNTNFEKKLFLNTYGFILSFLLWCIDLIFFNFIEHINFWAIPFFICMTFSIWYYEIKMEIVAEESVEGILDDNFIIPRK
jgi:hypothetical protein